MRVDVATVKGQRRECGGGGRGGGKAETADGKDVEKEGEREWIGEREEKTILTYFRVFCSLQYFCIKQYCDRKYKSLS